MTDQFDANACFLRSAWPGRNHDSVRAHGLNFFERHLVVAANLDLRAQFAQVLDEVISERIVVIEDEDHRFIVTVKRHIVRGTSSGLRVSCETLFLLLLDRLVPNCHAYRRFATKRWNSVNLKPWNLAS